MKYVKIIGEFPRIMGKISGNFRILGKFPRIMSKISGNLGIEYQVNS